MPRWRKSGRAPLHSAAHASAEDTPQHGTKTCCAPLDKSKSLSLAELKFVLSAYSALNGWDAGTKHLIRKGADAGAKDARGANAMEMAMGRGKIADEELFLMLAG